MPGNLAIRQLKVSIQYGQDGSAVVRIGAAAGFNRSIIIGGEMVLRERIELSTSPLPMECSTTELPQHSSERGGLLPHHYTNRKRPIAFLCT